MKNTIKEKIKSCHMFGVPNLKATKPSSYKQQCSKCKKWYKITHEPIGTMTCGSCMAKELKSIFG